MQSVTGDSAVTTPRPTEVPFPAFYEAVQHEPIYVILGVQGSGTNLLRRILLGSFNFSFIQDQAIVYNAAAQLGPQPTVAAVTRQFDVVRSRVFPSTLTRKMRRLVRGNASFDGIDRHFDPHRIRSAADFARFVYTYAAYTRGTPLMAIKSDDLWEHIDQIDRVLPNRRIILLTRDFRDNLLSITRKDFGPVEPLVAAQFVKERFAYYDAEFRRTRPEHRHHVRYEDLLEAPETVVSGLRKQFGLKGSGQAPDTVDKTRIRRHNVRKWAGLNRRELAHCEAILSDELRAYGYVPECDPPVPPGSSTWLLARGRDTMKRIPQKLGSVATRLRK
jgi:hypothetical protein